MEPTKQELSAHTTSNPAPNPAEKAGLLEKMKVIGVGAKAVGFVLSLMVPGLLANNPIHSSSHDFNTIMWVITLFAVSLFQGWRPGYAEFLICTALSLFVPAYFGISLGLERAITVSELLSSLTTPEHHVHPVMLPLMILGWYCNLYGWASFVASFIVGIFFAWIVWFLGSNSEK